MAPKGLCPLCLSGLIGVDAGDPYNRSFILLALEGLPVPTGSVLPPPSGGAWSSEVAPAHLKARVPEAGTLHSLPREALGLCLRL